MMNNQGAPQPDDHNPGGHTNPVHAPTIVRDLSQLAAMGKLFSTIYADPPWPYSNTASRAAAENHYRTMTLDAIRNEPVKSVAAENSHLHLWTTNAILRQAFDVMHDWGFTSFQFDWIANPDRAIYTLIIAAVWQGSGFAMAVFLATIRGVDPEIVKAAKIDGAGMVRTYWSVVMPLLRPAFLTVFIIMVALAIRTFDLMVAMTGGGPGFATDLPTNFMYQFAFGRQRLGLAAASSIMIFVSVLALMIPFIYGELRREARRER